MRPSSRLISSKKRPARPQVVLTFLAPADRCNQRCPACILERAGEPVTRHDLSPADYAQFVEELVTDSVPIRGVGFQGYEVTLPRSWPYLEAVFFIAKRQRILRSFITNGMLLDRHVGAIEKVDPHRLTVSLDGANPTVNDRLRGLRGAFLATTNSIERVLKHLPRIRQRMGIASVLYDEENYGSLLHMPTLLNRWGIPRWAVSVELEFSTGSSRPVRSSNTLAGWVANLREAAEKERIEFLFNDEFGFFREEAERGRPELLGETVFDPDWIVRVEPTGHVRVGRELLSVWRGEKERLWRRGDTRAAEVLGYPRDRQSVRLG